MKATEYYDAQPGDIGITQIGDVGGAAIRWAQRLNGEGFEDFEHVFGVVGNYGGRVVIIEAMPQGARIIDNWHDVNRTRWIKCPDQYRSLMADNLDALDHIPYSWADYGALAAHRFHVPVPGLREYIRDSRHLICSQLVDHAADVSGWHLFDDGRWEGYVTPASMNHLWERLPAEAKAGV